MNMTAIAITAIICGALIAFKIIDEVGKTRRAKITAEAEQDTPVNRFLGRLLGGSRQQDTEDESEGEE